MLAKVRDDRSDEASKQVKKKHRGDGLRWARWRVEEGGRGRGRVILMILLPGDD